MTSLKDLMLFDKSFRLSVRPSSTVCIWRIKNVSGSCAIKSNGNRTTLGEICCAKFSIFVEIKSSKKTQIEMRRNLRISRNETLSLL